MKTLILTEKPSVAREIAKVLGKTQSHDGYITVDSYVITWAVGHLISMAKPESYNQEWGSWNMDHLPMIPDKFKLMINKRTSKQFKIVKEWLTSLDIDKVILATDAGPEGELIGRWIYQKANCGKPMERLWISSVTNEAIRKGLNSLRPSSEFDLLYASAAARARADWIVGMNATRAVTMAIKSSMDSSENNPGVFSVGRVQSPTLKLIVDREEEIQEFEPEQYFEVFANFKDSEGNEYQGRFYNYENHSGRISDEVLAIQIKNEVERQTANEVNTETTEENILPPQLFSLSSLQQACNKRFRLTATETLDILQELYDGGLITYPRVADTVVTEDVAKEFPGILNRLKSKYADYLPGSIPSLLGNVRYVGPISDHHAVIPTGKLANIKSEMKLAVYDLIVKTFIAAHHPPGVDIVEKITTKVKDYVFLTSNTRTLTLGWRAIFHSNIITNSLLPISPPIKATAVLINEEETQPPSRYTEASILKAMERLGLGTPATRASIIENLKSKNYMLTLENSILPTEKGILLINFLENSKLVSPELTSSWEKHFNDIQSRKLSVEAFNIEVDDFVKAFVQEFKLSVGKNTKKQVVVLGDCPKCQEGKVLKLNRNNEHFYSCNRYQQGCRFFVSGKICEAIITESDVKQLLHKGRMPTKKFEFKTGRKKAQLILQKDGSTTFDFDNSIVSKIKNLLLRR